MDNTFTARSSTKSHQPKMNSKIEMYRIPLESNRKNLKIYATKVILLVLIFISTAYDSYKISFAQSIGPHTNVNLGFNPYLSPVFGYGLGLPHGTYGVSPLKFHPWLSSSILGLTHGSGNPLMSSLHAKTILKKIAPNKLGGYPYTTSLKDKLTALKYPELAYGGAYGMNYGYGKHYGSVMIPNNPYKSAYGDYHGYGLPSVPNNHQEPIPASSNEINTYSHQHDEGTIPVAVHKIPMHILKPIIKAGAFLTIMAILNKKTMDPPIKLNPAGMILNSRLASR